MRQVPSSIAILLMIATTACSRTALDERFHDRRLADWTALDDPDTLEGPSQWRVEADGWLHQRSNIWGRRGDFLDRWFGTLIVAGDAGWRNYVLSARAKPLDNDGFGLVFRLADSEHYYRLLLIEGGMNGGPLTRLYRRSGADYTQIWSMPGGYRSGTEMTIEVEVDGDRIRAQIDGRRLFEIQDRSYGRGKIGLFCYAQSDQAFDNVRVVLK